MPPQLACYACNCTTTYPDRICECGEPLWFSEQPIDEYPSDSPQSMWEFTEQLPVSNPDGLLSQIGGTPLYTAPKLSEEHGVSIYIKLESLNPSGSFKDRGSATGITYAVTEDMDVGTVSHGNMAISMATLAAETPAQCTVLVPSDIPPNRLTQISQFNPTIFKVDGSYADLYSASFALGENHNTLFVNSDTPLRVAGQKTLGLELLAGLHPTVPDAICLPVSSGGNTSAIWKALRELSLGGLLPQVPKLLLVQASACDPIATAYRHTKQTISPDRAGKETIAYSIANANPPSGNRALAAVNDTNGAVCSVSDNAIRNAQQALLTNGISVEPASATVLAGLTKFKETGEISPGDSIAVILTGTGIRNPMETQQETPKVTLDSLDEWL